MRQPDLPAEGGCRCGAVRFRITQPPMMTSVCHCHGCQHMTGGAYSTTAMIHGTALEEVTGRSVRGGLRSGMAHHQHCPDCHGWVFTRFDVEAMPFVNVRATMFDDASWFAPFMESQTVEALPWARVAAPRSFERFPHAADYPELIEAYAKAAAAGS